MPPDLAIHLVPQIEEIQRELSQRRETVSTAESCTGGLLASWLTQLPGSSAVYLGGVSAYANSVKQQVLHVDQKLLNNYGAVSPEVAQAMAASIRKLTGSTYALSITGIAGPGGGTAEKPVGTVFCGIASPRGVRFVHLGLSGDRDSIRHQSAQRAIAELKEEIPK
ncbi:hypothetical protein E3A20_06890 [Planctomyces bekefii]|uniref:CinA C-terminal domain-containing protein n=1 Tax=Planctomyces bekefii TaxID=1653850 RepID=A0A5C6M8S4_9PLAN|nr:hypothetical protein E3A20_06890 [Planctomyces bekefii]